MATFSTHNTADNIDYVVNSKYEPHMPQNQKKTYVGSQCNMLYRMINPAIVTKQRELEILKINTEKSWPSAIRMNRWVLFEVFTWAVEIVMLSIVWEVILVSTEQGLKFFLAVLLENVGKCTK